MSSRKGASPLLNPPVVMDREAAVRIAVRIDRRLEFTAYVCGC